MVTHQPEQAKKKPRTLLQTFTAFDFEALILYFLPRTKNVNAGVVSWLIEPFNGGKI